MSDADSVTPEPNAPLIGAATTFDGFVDRYRATAPIVLAYLMRATGNDRSLSEDLTSDVYVRAMKAWKLGNSDAGREPWLITTARNRLIDHLRRIDVEQRKLALVHSQDATAIDSDFAGIEAASILACARELPPLQRAVLALRYADDLPVAEIAFQLDRSVDAIESLLRRARSGLRALIDSQPEDRP
jgi:RNA polymerase sigma-70 factor, ECF subfamily